MNYGTKTTRSEGLSEPLRERRTADRSTDVRSIPGDEPWN
jgi:hypothetical protein